MTSLACPECGATSLFKNGWRKLASGEKVQTYICRQCSYRFTDPTLPKISSQRRLSSHVGIYVGSQICAQKAKNLEPRQETTKVAGETSRQDSKGKIVTFEFWLLKQGYSKATITSRRKLLNRMLRLGADFNDEDSIKTIIANASWSISRKVNAVDAYDSLLKMEGKTWTPPIYKRVRKLPFIPTEMELDSLIAGCSKTISTFLQLLKETGMRSGEACGLLKWTDIDFEQRTVRITPEKGSNPRILPISIKLANMLGSLPQKGETVFGVRSDLIRRNFGKQRKRLAIKLKNQRIKQITFHTFRHWKATMEYHKTRDILHVKEVLGHKSLNNTMLYTQLIAFNDDEFTAAVAHTEQEACKLIEAGFAYVCDFGANKLFKKRK
jgi:integrase